MSVVPTNGFSKALDNLRTLLSNCATFQTWVGAGSAAAALASIHVMAVEGDSLSRPFAVVFPADGADSREAIAGGGAQVFLPSGRLEILFEDDVASANESDYADALYEFTNNLGSVISDMEDLSGTGTYLVVKNIAITEGPARSDDDDRSAANETYYQAVVAVEWGI